MGGEVRREATRGLLVATALAVLLCACAPAPPPILNAPQFAVRAALPGRPGYQQTIRYIDDGVRYIDPTSAFFVWTDGRMCFRGLLNARRTLMERNHDWCMPPYAVSRVDNLWNDTTGVPEMLLWCKHGYPDCVRDNQNLLRATNFALVQILPGAPEKYAIEHLVFLMGGNLGDDQPFAQSLPLVRPWLEPPAR